MKHRITREEGELVRWLASGALPDVDRPPPAHSDRIWRAPNASGDDDLVGVVPASGRAGCRECGETIETGSDAIAFGFTPTGSVWAVGRAYIHRDPCVAYPEED